MVVELIYEGKSAPDAAKLKPSRRPERQTRSRDSRTDFVPKYSTPGASLVRYSVSRGMAGIIKTSGSEYVRHEIAVGSHDQNANFSSATGSPKPVDASESTKPSLASRICEIDVR